MNSWKKHKNEIMNSLDSLYSINIAEVIELIWGAFLDNKRIFLIGNGGSAANASHFAQDLCKTTYIKKYGLTLDETNKTFKAISLCDNISFITAIANDNGYNYIFCNQLKTFAPEKGDILFAISGSGKSYNILDTVVLANKCNMTTVGLTGFDGGELIDFVKFKIHVKSSNMLIVESIHSIILHFIIEELTKKRYDNNV